MKEASDLIALILPFIGLIFMCVLMVSSWRTDREHRRRRKELDDEFDQWRIDVGMKKRLTLVDKDRE